MTASLVGGAILQPPKKPSRTSVLGDGALHDTPQHSGEGEITATHSAGKTEIFIRFRCLELFQGQTGATSWVLE